MTPEYKRLAYEVSVCEAAIRGLQEKYLPGGGGQKEVLICELVPHADRNVPEEALLNFVQRLQAASEQLKAEMAKYELRKRDESQPLPPPKKPQSEVRASAQAAPAKPGRKARRA